MKTFTFYHENMVVWWYLCGFIRENRPNISISASDTYDSSADRHQCHLANRNNKRPVRNATWKHQINEIMLTMAAADLLLSIPMSKAPTKDGCKSTLNIRQSINH